jgi:hypothetical protein
MRALAVEVCGLHARRFVERHAAARIAAVFARSLHLEASGDFLCLGDRSIGCGPLNAILSCEAWASLRGAAPPAGASARIDRGRIRLGAACLETARSALWCAARWPKAADRRHVAEAVDRLAQHCITRAPRDGLARVVLLPQPEQSSPLARLARPRIERLRSWLDDRQPSLADKTPPTDLLGLGPGLTPCGDDLLCGALVALRAVGWNDAADRLASAIDRAAPAATSPLSRSFLRAAAEGLAAEALHALILGVLSERPGPLVGDVEALNRIGHTSGWDALAGTMLVLQAFGTSAVRSTGVASPELSL